MRRSIGEGVFLCGKTFVFCGVGDSRIRKLSDLEPQQIDLSCSRSLVSAQRGKRRIDLGQACSGGAQRLEVGRAVAI